MSSTPVLSKHLPKKIADRAALLLTAVVLVLIGNWVACWTYWDTRPVLETVATKALQAKHVLKPVDLEFKFGRVPGDDKTEFPGKERLIGETLAHDVSSGHVIMESDLQTAPVQPLPKADPDSVNDIFIYFAHGDRELPVDAQNTLQSIINTATKDHSCRLDLDGFADRSGTPKHNLWLSRERADGVADLLRLNKVADQQLHVTPHGDENPRITTMRGVREARNRRVEVHIACPSAAKVKTDASTH